MIDEHGIFVKNEMKIEEQKTILLVEDDAILAFAQSMKLFPCRSLGN